MSKQITCKLCGTVEKLCWNEQINFALTTKERCFTCNFWENIERWDRLHPGRGLVVEDKDSNRRMHYHIGPENSPGVRGFGGSKFRIVFTDDREQTSTNLWCQGEIPKHFYEKFPVTARFKAWNEK